jgi:hypothetical protein
MAFLFFLLVCVCVPGGGGGGFKARIQEWCLLARAGASRKEKIRVFTVDGAALRVCEQ